MPSNRTSAPSPSVRMLSAIAAGSSGSSRSATTPRRSPIAPPLTGGITASSSPSFSGSSHPAYSEFTAQRKDRGSGPRSYFELSWLQASAGGAPIGSAHSHLERPQIVFRAQLAPGIGGGRPNRERQLDVGLAKQLARLGKEHDPNVHVEIIYPDAFANLGTISFSTIRSPAKVRRAIVRSVPPNCGRVAVPGLMK